MESWTELERPKEKLANLIRRGHSGGRKYVMVMIITGDVVAAGAF